MMIRIPVGILVAGMIWCIPLAAQTDVLIHRMPGPPPPPPPPGAIGIVAQAPTFQFIAAEPAFIGKTVKGAPYSADSVTESTRVLADGTRIKNSNSVKVYRDSEGRIRREMTLERIGGFEAEGAPQVQISIIDPVAGKTYILNPETRVARAIEMPPAPPAPPAPPDAPEAPRAEEAGKRMEWRTVRDEVVVTATVAPDAPAAPVAPGAPAPPAPPHAKRVIDTMIRVGPGPGGFASFSRQILDRGIGSEAKEELGEQMIQGVRTVGTRSTTTIPVGAIGNDRPIVSVTEEWYSPELETVVLRTVKDPQAGETVFRLDNLSRSEPLKSLFEIPAGYEVKETKPVIEHIRIEKKAEDGE